MYVLTYGLYFGTSLVQAIPVIIEGNATPEYALNTMVSAIGIVIPVCVLIDLLLDKNRKAHPVDKKTDCFYKNEQFDREIDERADKNNYRTL